MPLNEDARPRGDAEVNRRLRAPLDYQQYLATRRYPALDGLRAIAVMLVISWHVSGGWLQALRGDNGVIIFFVLSGFLITALCLRDERRDGFLYLPFIIKRGFRILPLLYLGVAVYAVAVFVLHLDPRADAYRAALPWILGYFPEVPVLGVPSRTDLAGPVPFAGVWTLGIEEKFYLTWPVLAFGLLTRSRHRAYAAVGLCSALWLFPLVGPAAINRFSFHYAPLLLGSGIACFLAMQAGHRIATCLTHGAVAMAALLALVVLTVVDTGLPSMIGYQVAVAVILTHLVLRPQSLVARILATKPFVFIAVQAYALYLFHSFGLKAARYIIGDAPAVFELIVGLAVAVPACWVLHVALERPMQAVGRRIASRTEATIRRRRARRTGAETAPRQMTPRLAPADHSLPDSNPSLLT